MEEEYFLILLNASSSLIPSLIAQGNVDKKAIALYGYFTLDKEHLIVTTFHQVLLKGHRMLVVDISLDVLGKQVLHRSQPLGSGTEEEVKAQELVQVGQLGEPLLVIKVVTFECTVSLKKGISLHRMFHLAQSLVWNKMNCWLISAWSIW